MLTNLSKEKLYLMCAKLKSEFSLWGMSKRPIPSERSIKDISSDVLTVCNELMGLLDQSMDLERALKLARLVKEVHNHVSNH